MHDLPFWVGALGLAAVFSAEVSAADAMLFMLSTSLSQDLYKRFVNPAATDRQVLTVARAASVVGGVAAVVVAMLSKTIVDALSDLLHAGRRQPVRAGRRRALPAPARRAPDALAAIAGGIVDGAWRCSSGTTARRSACFTPAMCGLAAAAAAFALVVGAVSRTETMSESGK